MAVFPLFIDLKARKCVVAGGGKVASRKIQALVEFNAEIIVVSPSVTAYISELGRAGKLLHIQREYFEDDIEGAFLVIAATSDKQVNEKVYQDAVKKGIFVNIADNPEKCTFIFPSIVKRDELVIGISTSGSYPALSKSLRKKIEGLIEGKMNKNITGLLSECRKRAASQISSSDKRKEIINRILDEAVFCDDITDEKQMTEKIEGIFGEYGDEKGNQGWNPGKQTGCCAEQMGNK